MPTFLAPVGIVGTAANGPATIGTNTTTAAGGLWFGTDTNLYRSAADTLKTDDTFVALSLSLPTASGSITGSQYYGGVTPSGVDGMRHFFVTSGFIDAKVASSTDGIVFRVNTTNGDTERMRIRADGIVAIGGALLFGGDTNLYRSAADTLKTDDTLVVVGSVIGSNVALAGLTGATAANRYVGGTTSGNPVSGTFAKGDFVVDQTGKIWVNTTAGSPGTFTDVSSASPYFSIAKWGVD